MPTDPSVIIYQNRQDGTREAIVVSSNAHRYLGMDPAKVPFQEVAIRMRDLGWEGPALRYLPSLPKSRNQLHRGYRKIVQPGEVVE